MKAVVLEGELLTCNSVKCRMIWRILMVDISICQCFFISLWTPYVIALITWLLQLWRTILLRPFKLVTVFLHEASHAIACKLTCGKVRSSFLSSSFIIKFKHGNFLQNVRLVDFKYCLSVFLLIFFPIWWVNMIEEAVPISCNPIFMKDAFFIVSYESVTTTKRGGSKTGKLRKWKWSFYDLTWLLI